MKCVYLGMDSLEGYVSDADLSIPAMRQLGWRVEKYSWRDEGVDWSAFDLVYLCTPWDYHEHLDDFLSALVHIDAAGPLLVNDLETVRWNAVKTYLGDLSARGLPVVPTRFHDSYDSDGIRAAFDTFETDRVVIKPTVSANALHTIVLDRDSFPGRESELQALFAGRAHMLQPFYTSVPAIGEYSLFFFDGDYSHAILKTPADGDFRTQEEHGSDIQPHTADDAMLELAARITASLSQPVAYARVDLVLNDADSPELMELELIEPSLYFRTDPASPARFAKGITDFYQRKASR